MNPRTSMNPRTWTLILVVLGAAILGWSDRRDSYSCHVCRARRAEQSQSFLGWTYRTRSTATFPGAPKAGHVHDWWRYSYSYRNGLGGLGRGVACNAHRYRDGGD